MSDQDNLLFRYLGISPRTPEAAVLRLMVQLAVQAVEGDEGSLLVFDPEARDLTFVMTYGSDESESVLIGQRVPLGKGITGLAAETGEVQIGAPTFKDVDQTEAVGQIQSVIAAPMMLDDRLMGVITAISNRAEKRFSIENAELYAAVATIAAVMVDQNQRLKAYEGAEDAGEAKVMGASGLEQEIYERVGNLLRRDPATVRQVANVLEAIDGMTGGGETS
jgi:GAF domain-containing protein